MLRQAVHWVQSGHSDGQYRSHFGYNQTAVSVFAKLTLQCAVTNLTMNSSKPKCKQTRLDVQWNRTAALQREYEDVDETSVASESDLSMYV